MPIRAAVGRPDGVTNASISRTRTARRPARARPRRPPGRPRPAPATAAAARARSRPSPVRSPTPAGDEDGGQLEQSVRQDQAEEQRRPCPRRACAPPTRPRLTHVLPQDVERADDRDAQEHAHRGDERVVGPHLRGERLRRVRGVVVGEVVVDQLADVARRRSPATAARGWSRRYSIIAAATREAGRRDADPPAPGAVDGHREVDGDAVGQRRPARPAAADRGGPRAGQHADSRAATTGSGARDCTSARSVTPPAGTARSARRPRPRSGGGGRRARPGAATRRCARR